MTTRKPQANKKTVPAKKSPQKASGKKLVSTKGKTKKVFAKKVTSTPKSVPAKSKKTNVAKKSKNEKKTLQNKKPTSKKNIVAKKKVATKKVLAAKKPTAVKKNQKVKKPALAKKQAIQENKRIPKKLLKGKPAKATVPAKNKKQEPAPKISVKTEKNKKPQNVKPAQEDKKISAKKVLAKGKEPAAKQQKSGGKTAKKSKEVSVTTGNEGISVPREVSKIGNQSKIAFHRSAIAYTPLELEQLLFQRGVTNMNLFNPNAIPVVHTKKPVEKKIILTTLPKSTKKEAVGAVSMADLFGFDPFAKDSVSAEEKLIPAKWNKYYHKLVERKNELMETINRHSQNAFRKEGKEETGDVSAYSQHTADIDNEAFDREFAISRLATEQEELSEINIAVERMKKGTYGICEITGKPIPAERLNKVPFTRYSLEGKIKAEEQRRAEARRRRANITGDISEVIDIENDAPITLSEEREEP